MVTADETVLTMLNNFGQLEVSELEGSDKNELQLNITQTRLRVAEDASDAIRKAKYFELQGLCRLFNDQEIPRIFFAWVFSSIDEGVLVYGSDGRKRDMLLAEEAFTLE